MGIFDVFTGASARRAADENKGLYQQYGQQAQGALDRGVGQATGALDTGLTRSTDALGTNTNRAYNILGTGLQGQLGALGEGQGQAVDAYGQSLDAYSPLSALGTKYGAATGLALDAYGANGAEGNARATGAFQAGPGYEWARSQALDAGDRSGVARGQAVGNTIAGNMERATGLANQEYNNWRTGLTGFVAPELQATSGAASGRSGVLDRLAELYSTGGAARAGAIGNNTTAGSNLWNTYGQNEAGLYGTDANTRAGLFSNNAQNQSNVFGNVASGTANSNTAAANAEQAGSAAFWNGLMNLGGAALGAAFPRPRAA